VPGETYRDFGATSIRASGALLVLPERLAASATAIEATDFRFGLPSKLLIKKPVMLAPGNLEVAMSAAAGEVDFDGFLRQQMAGEDLAHALEKSLRSILLKEIDFRLAGGIHSRAADASLELRPVLGLGGNARRGNLFVSSAELTQFHGPAHISRAIAAERRPLSATALVERSEDGEWSLPEFSIEQPDLAVISGRLTDIFSPGFSGEVIYEERTLVQRLMQAMALFENASIPFARSMIAGWAGHIFRNPEDSAMAAFLENPDRLQVAWTGRPELASLRWSLPEART